MPNQITTHLPEKCPTCGAKRTYVGIETRYGDTESAEYQCGLELRCYRNKPTERETQRGCPKSASEIAKRERQAAFDQAVGAACNRLKMTWAEGLEFASRTGSAQYSHTKDRGFLAHLKSKPKD